MNAEQRTPVIATSPAELVTLFIAHLNDGDVETLVEFYDEDGSFSPQDGVVVTGKEAIREVLMGFTAMQPTVTSDVKWVQQVGSFALVLNDWTLEGRQPDGEAVSMTGRSTDVARCGEDGGWRYYIDCLWGGS